MHKICIKYAEKYARNMTNMQRNMKNMPCGSIMENMQENMQNMQNLRTMPKICKVCTPHLADGRRPPVSAAARGFRRLGGQAT